MIMKLSHELIRYFNSIREVQRMVKWFLGRTELFLGKLQYCFKIVVSI